ncbi:MAG: amidohydrolase [Gammaproteobacteria bacterium]|nr:amidohydrolase [Gammaproteobacteria bacterium]
MFLRLAIILFFISTLADAYELNDGHIHYNQDIWGMLKPEEALRLLSENNIQRAIVSSTPTSGTETLYQLNPEQVIPFLRPYRNIRDRNTWHSDPTIINHIKQQLKKGFYKGLGEFHLFRQHKDTDIIQKIMQLAADHKLVISAHSDAETIEALLNMQPELTVIWAHCGMDDPVPDIKQMLQTYKKLHCELSFRNDITDESGKITTEWKALFQTFPERFITGSDTYIPRRWAELPEITATNRNWLDQLNSRTAKLIGKRNINRLFPTLDDSQR